MIWKVNNKTWYSKDIIDKIKEVLHKRPYHTIEKVLKIIEEAEK